MLMRRPYRPATRRGRGRAWTARAVHRLRSLRRGAAGSLAGDGQLLLPM